MPGPETVNRYNYPVSEQRRLWDENYIFDTFQVSPVTAKAGGGAASGTALTQNIMAFPYTQLEYVPIGTQTITAPVINVDGLNLGSLDQTDAEGLEICPGITARAMPSFVIGDSAAFFVRGRFKIADVSGVTSLMLGFRQVEAYQAAASSYANFVSINVNAGQLDLVTNKASAGVVTTNTTQSWLDGAEHELLVIVDAAGNVTYQIDTQEPVVTAAYQFIDATRVVPFIRFIQSADIAGAVPLEVLECGTVA